MAQVSGGQPQQQQKSLTPQDVGLGRMDIMGLPIGPKLTVSSIPDGGLQGGPASFQGGPPNQPSTLNLQPSGTKLEQDLNQAQAMETLNDSLWYVEQKPKKERRVRD